jgi:uncharacterized membrane protein YoaK (UPF0700 family)
MSSKLPAWLGVGAFILTCAAGTINAFALLNLEALPVSHLSGTTTNLAVSVAEGNLAQIAQYALLLGSFVAGALVSGFIIRDSHLKLGRRYGFSLLIESALVLIVMLTFKEHPQRDQLILAFACGLQNAMATTYSGAVIRTTHLTGVFTDLGILLGQWAARVPVSRRKLLLYADLIGGFCLGGLLAGLLHPRLGTRVLLIPIISTGALSLFYFAYWIRHNVFKVPVRPGSTPEY